MQHKGVCGSPTLSWPDLVTFKRTFTEGVSQANAEALARARITAVAGRARWVGPTALEVGGEVFGSRYLVVAAGARHAPWDIEDEEHLPTSTGFLELDHLPRRIAFVGGGTSPSSAPTSPPEPAPRSSLCTGVASDVGYML